MLLVAGIVLVVSGAVGLILQFQTIRERQKDLETQR
jgi:hypothetical protein